jgi:hypothetical protein
MPPTANKRNSSSDWQAESLRLTAFLTPSVQPNGGDWWASIAGTQPETRTAKPALGQLVDSGTFEDNMLTLSIQAGRIDWFLGPNPAVAQDSSVPIKSVGPFSSALDGFLRAMLKWLELCPPVLRLAYGVVLLEPTESKEAGYKRLAESLPSIRLDAKDSEDFFYQINRPRQTPANLGHLKVNRLSKWSVSSFQMFSSVIAPDMKIPYQHLGPKTLVCRLELDISTPAEKPDELPHEKLKEIFRELTVVGTEIAEKGDVP